MEWEYQVFQKLHLNMEAIWNTISMIQSLIQF